MESRAKFAGHAVHPILIVFPLGLLSTAVVFDIIFLISGTVEWTRVAYYLIGAGAIGGLAAAVFGWIDWIAIPGRTRAKRVGLAHGVGNVVVVGLFILSWVLRRPDPVAPPTGAIVAGFAGLVLAAITGWLGGELVMRLGIGVDDGAHPDAPSSLSERPAGVNRAIHHTMAGGYAGIERRGFGQPAYAGVERRAWRRR